MQPREAERARRHEASTLAALGLGPSTGGRSACPPLVVITDPHVDGRFAHDLVHLSVELGIGFGFRAGGDGVEDGLVSAVEQGISREGVVTGSGGHASGPEGGERTGIAEMGESVGVLEDGAVLEAGILDHVKPEHFIATLEAAGVTPVFPPPCACPG